MERLTARNKDGEAYFPECYRKDKCDGFGGDCESCRFSDRVCEHLAAYEDTGLTPDQIRQMDRLYREKCEELSRYKAAIAEASEGNPDAKLYLDSYNKGWMDAVIFIRSGAEGETK